MLCLFLQKQFIDIQKKLKRIFSQQGEELHSKFLPTVFSQCISWLFPLLSPSFCSGNCILEVFNFPLAYQLFYTTLLVLLFITTLCLVKYFIGSPLHIGFDLFDDNSRRPYYLLFVLISCLLLSEFKIHTGVLIQSHLAVRSGK